MDWIDEFNEQKDAEVGADKAFTVLHEGPPTLTTRQINSLKDQQAIAFKAKEKKLKLASYPALYQGEPEAIRLKRDAVFEQSWDNLSQAIQTHLEAMDAKVFTSIRELAHRHHPPPEVRATLPRHGQHRIPTGLVLAGGVNSADHVTTFPNLASYLQDFGCYVALLHSNDIGKTPAEALNACMRQLSKLNTSVDEFDALTAWYRDETVALDDEEEDLYGGDGGDSDSNNGDNDDDAVDIDAAGPSNKRSKIITPTSTKRTRNQPMSQQQTTPRNKPRRLTAAERHANAKKPIVVIVEGTESVDPGCLHDVVSIFSEGYAEIPVTLILGLTTTESALQAMLPTQLIDRCMQCTHYKLATAMAQLETLVRDVLLGATGTWPGLVLDGGVVNALWDKFLLHYFSSSIIRQGIQTVALSHFRNQPASFLAVEASQGKAALKSACQTLPDSVAVQVKKVLGVDGQGSKSGAATAEAIYDAMLAYSQWALAVLWTSAVAQEIGLTNGYTCWQLYRDASTTGFAASMFSKDLGPRLQRQMLHRLEDNNDKAFQIVDMLSGIADCIWGGAQLGVEQELTALKQQMRDTVGGGATPGGGGGGNVQEDVDAIPIVDGDDGVQEPHEGLTTASTKQKRDRFHSKASRSAAMLSKASTAKKTGRGVNSQGGGKTPSQTAQIPTPATVLANWLIRYLNQVYSKPPTKMPGIKVFLCSDVSALNCLSAAPRDATHTALIQPQAYLGPTAVQGLDPRSEDACIAYQLFDQDTACQNIADWFEAFCEVHLSSRRSDGAGEEEEVEQAGTSKRGGGKKGGKKGVARIKPTAEDVHVASERRKELAVRFSQATAELQLCGLIKPASKRRRGDYVQRVVHMPASMHDI